MLQATTNRLYVLARHGQSSANSARVLDSDPDHAVGLTSQGIDEARLLGLQVANIDFDLAVATRFLRTQQTVELALGGREVPLLVEPDLDEVDVGRFGGGSIDAYWSWRERHSWTEQAPSGESRAEAVARYGAALRRLLERGENRVLIVMHEHGLRSIAAAAAGDWPGYSEAPFPNALPFLFEAAPLARAAVALEAVQPLR